MSLPLKVMINKEKTKVLFAEANTDFVNVLLSFLASPLGKANVKSYNFTFGSLNTLYRGLYNNMDESYFSVRGAKEMLLNPQNSFRAECRKLVLDIIDSHFNKIYVCSDPQCPITEAYNNVSMYSDIATCECGKWLNREIGIRGCQDLEGGAFVTNPSSFIITDDLRVVPILNGLFQTLSNLGITNTQGAEMKSLSFGIDEIRKLFHFCLTSATPLADMIFKKTGLSSTVAKPEPAGILLRHIPKEKDHSRKMVLKVFLQKSTDKFLYAEAMDDFVEFLFSFLTIPLGGVESHLGGNTGLIGIDNLYRSLSHDIDVKCFRTPEMKNRLIDPKLRHGYISKNQFLPLSEDTPPELHYITVYNNSVIKNTSFYEENTGFPVYKFKSSKEVFVKKYTKCIVTDDLTVDPCLAKSILILNKLQIPLSDVREMELHIGLEEALGIMKASLTSKTVLTDVLIKPMLDKRQKLEIKPKQEP